MVTVPENKILSIPYDGIYRHREHEVFVSLRGHGKRDWFVNHAYYCLPLVIGNQYGFAVKSLIEATLVWNGQERLQDTTITLHDQPQDNIQTIRSHFGQGIVTVQTPFTLRTPPNVNLITMQPPNYYIDGLQNMVAVIECDNLRRDFTFNLKITRANHPIRIRVGDLLAAFMPVPRNYVNQFELVDGYEELSQEIIDEEQRAMRDFAREREGPDRLKKNAAGRRYHRGEDVYGTRFPHPHQTHLKPNHKDTDDATEI